MSDDKTPAPLFLILVLWASGLGAAMQFAKVTVSLEALQVVYSGSDTVIGLLLSSISLLGVILGLVAGLMVASYGFRRILLWALFGGAFLSVLQTALPPLPLFMVSRVFEGASHLGIVVAAPTLIAVVCPERWRFMAMTLWSAFFAVGYAITTAIGPILVEAFGAPGVFVAHAGFMALVGVVLAIYLPKGTTEREPFPPLKDLLGRHWAAYRSPYQFAPGAIWLFYTCTFVSVMSVVPPLLTDTQRTVLVPLLPVAGILCSFTISAVLLRYLRAVRVVQIGLASCLVFSLTGFVLPLSGAMLFGLFFCMGLVQSASFASVPQLNPNPKAQALANGVLSQMGNTGNLIGTPLMFALFNFFGVTAIYVMLICCYGAALVAHGWLAYLRRQQEALA